MSGTRPSTFWTGQTYRDGNTVADRSYSIGTPFCCKQLSGVKLMGSKVLKKTSENSLYVRESPIAPVGHSVHLKKSCGLAYQTSPAPVISKSRATLNSSNGSLLYGNGATKHTQSWKQNNIIKIGYDIGYDVVNISYDIGSDIRHTFGFLFLKR
jgi:hypothetical protein